MDDGEIGQETWRERCARLRIVHEEVIGTRGRTGPMIALLGKQNWEVDTFCGERVSTNRVTRLPVRVTCDECRTVALNGGTSTP